MMSYGSAMVRWTADDIPSLMDKIAVVTGANSGLGYETALELARHGARVVLACRSLDKAATAEARIRAEVPNAELACAALDLASLASVRAFADGFCADHEHLDILCNNAGIMAIPRRETEDGFEMQLGTNHLGHFALTGLLLEPLFAAPAARVVTVSSLVHVVGKIRFDDLQSVRSYEKWLAYAQSKLANLLFTYELARRLEDAGQSTIAVAAHPGYASTHLQLAAPEMTGSSFTKSVFQLSNRTFAQTAAMGALPTLRAATAPEVRNGDYYGPSDLFESRGYPKRVRSNARSRDREAQRKLFEVSEELTGVRYGLA